MIGASIGKGATRILDKLVSWLANGGVHPNILTFIGVAISVTCGLLFGFGKFFAAGIVLIIANLFDMLDGNVARKSGNVTKFGGFLDSSLDRISDMIVFIGIIIFYASNTPQRSIVTVFAGCTAMMFSVMVSYTAARSDSLGVKANVGFLQRPERMVLLMIGALSTWSWTSQFYFANRMPQVLWIIAIGSFWTFLQRMIYTWRKMQEHDVG